MIRLSERQIQHIQTTLQLEDGDLVKAGLVDGKIGAIRLHKSTSGSIHGTFDETSWDTSAVPSALPCRLILALSRPKMLRRIFQMVASIGIKQIAIVNSYRVEKSFWSSPLLRPESIREQLILGLEQGIDTTLPEVTLYNRFKPFVEDILPSWSDESMRLVAHPYDSISCPAQVTEPVTLAIGPEGGFIPYEVEKFVESGFRPVSLGTRIFRVETAVPLVVGRLFPVSS